MSSPPSGASMRYPTLTLPSPGASPTGEDERVFGDALVVQMRCVRAWGNAFADDAGSCYHAVRDSPDAPVVVMSARRIAERITLYECDLPAHFAAWDPHPCMLCHRQPLRAHEYERIGRGLVCHACRGCVEPGSAARRCSVCRAHGGPSYQRTFGHDHKVTHTCLTCMTTGASDKRRDALGDIFAAPPPPRALRARDDC